MSYLFVYNNIYTVLFFIIMIRNGQKKKMSCDQFLFYFILVFNNTIVFIYLYTSCNEFFEYEYLSIPYKL